MWSVVPLPYRILIVVGLVLGLYGSGVLTGWHFADQAAEVARLQKEAKDAKALADARAKDAHNAHEDAALGHQQYLDEQALVAALQAKVARHEQEQPPEAPQPAAQADPPVCPGAAPIVPVPCPSGLSDARARWLRELATAPAGGAAGAARPPFDIRHPGSRSPGS